MSYIDVLIVFINKKFGDYVKEMYPSQLTVEKANTSDDRANYLDLTSIIESNNRLYTKLYDKRDDVDFHIVDFPFLLSNIPFSPPYGVYISQLIRYARCCSYYDDFGYRHKLLFDRFLSQGSRAAVVHILRCCTYFAWVAYFGERGNGCCPCFILGFAIAPLRRKFFPALLCAVIVADLCLILGFAIAPLRRKFFAARFFRGNCCCPMFNVGFAIAPLRREFFAAQFCAINNADLH